MSLQERHVAQPSVRTRPLQVTCFAVNRWLGELPTHLHTDVRTLLMKFVRDASGKGKTIELSSRESVLLMLHCAPAASSAEWHLHQAVDQWKMSLASKPTPRALTSITTSGDLKVMTETLW